MRVLPVLDVQQGVVVRGVAGRREEYRPIRSLLTTSVFPVTVAEAFRAHFGLTELYLADLDAIAGGPPSLKLYQLLQALGFHLWVDAGLRSAADAEPLAQASVAKIVAGLETLAGPEVLQQLCKTHGSERIVFSLDLRKGRPLGNVAAWQGDGALAIAVQAIEMGVRSILLLDLAHVGTGEGTGTEALLRRLSETHAGIEWLVGGGVREAADLHRLRDCGANGVLIASALHDGRLTRDDLPS